METLSESRFMDQVVQFILRAFSYHKNYDQSPKPYANILNPKENKDPGVQVLMKNYLPGEVILLPTPEWWRPMDFC